MEGVDDQHSVVHLLRRQGYDWDDGSLRRPFVHRCGGLEPLLGILPVAVKGPYERLGVVLDADLDMVARWHRLRHAAHSVGLVLPEEPEPKGTIVAGLRSSCRVGFWIMPDNSTTGTLEDFLRTLVPPCDPCWARAEEAVGRALGEGCGTPRNRAKHLLHTWLAWQDPPGMPFGTALSAQVLDSDGPLAARFVSWFHEIFPREPAAPK